MKQLSFVLALYRARHMSPCVIGTSKLDALIEVGVYVDLLPQF